MRIYLAARYSRRLELCRYADDLRRLGHEVTSRWLEGDHQIADDAIGTEEGRDAAVRFALEDWSDLLSSDVVISFTEVPRTGPTRGGRHVEYGAALAAGLRCIVCGPLENVFHYMPQVERFEAWAEVRHCLDEGDVDRWEHEGGRPHQERADD